VKPWLALSGLLVAADQLAKLAATSLLEPGVPVPVAPFLDLVLVYNRGAAFSLLAQASGWQRPLFIAIALAASVLIVHLLRRHARERLFALALSLVLGGALGNLVDRVWIGAVVDFLDFHAFGLHWPAFNLADAAISCGAGLLVWDALRARKDLDRGRAEGADRGS
jgi:signal peptidase II